MRPQQVSLGCEALTSHELLNKYLPGTTLGQEVSRSLVWRGAWSFLQNHSQCAACRGLLSCPEELRFGGREWQSTEAVVGWGLTLKAQGRHTGP